MGSWKSTGLVVLSIIILVALLALFVFAALTFDPCICGCWVYPAESTLLRIALFGVAFLSGIVSGMLFSIKADSTDVATFLKLIGPTIVIVSVIGLFLLSSVVGDVVSFMHGDTMWGLRMTR